MGQAGPIGVGRCPASIMVRHMVQIARFSYPLVSL